MLDQSDKKLSNFALSTGWLGYACNFVKSGAAIKEQGFFYHCVGD
jgi:hypothetical protein